MRCIDCEVNRERGMRARIGTAHEFVPLPI